MIKRYEPEQETPVIYICGCGRHGNITSPSGLVYCWRCWDKVKKPDWRDQLINEKIGESNA